VRPAERGLERAGDRGKHATAVIASSKLRSSILLALLGP
jgi:hypothetical protein